MLVILPDMDSAPVISSFVIRIIQDKSPETSLPMRGIIRHVQSDQELSFTRLTDAFDFINKQSPWTDITPGEETEG